VLRIGEISAEIVSLWASSVEDNLEVVITGARRAHYLQRHPDIEPWEIELAATLLDPDEVHRNRQDPEIATFYRRADEGHFTRASVAMQAVSGPRKHSVITYRLARAREVQRGRALRRWTKS
jgi:hypothetical protein